MKSLSMRLVSTWNARRVLQMLILPRNVLVIKIRRIRGSSSVRKETDAVRLVASETSVPDMSLHIIIMNGRTAFLIQEVPIFVVILVAEAEEEEAVAMVMAAEAVVTVEEEVIVTTPTITIMEDSLITPVTIKDMVRIRTTIIKELKTITMLIIIAIQKTVQTSRVRMAVMNNTSSWTTTTSGEHIMVRSIKGPRLNRLKAAS